MTNAERFIGDEDEIDTFIEEVTDFFVKEEGYYNKEYIENVLVNFFKQPVIPALTEDERVILRNIKNDDFGKYIGRGDVLSENRPRHFDLYLRGDSEYKAYAIGSMYNHLFQFIKERRRILNRRIVGR